MEFVSERLVVRRITKGDYHAMLEVYSDLELMRYVGDSTAISPEDCARWVDVTLNNYVRQGYGLFFVEDRESGEHIGFVGLTHPGGRPEPEIKYVLRRKYWGHGLAQELVQATVAEAHKKWKREIVIATVDPDNAASHRVLAKSGFVRDEDIECDDGSITVVWKHLAEYNNLD